MQEATDSRPLTERLEEQYETTLERADNIQQSVREVNDQAIDFIRENPGWAIVGAFGVGYLLGSIAARRWII